MSRSWLLSLGVLTCFAGCTSQAFAQKTPDGQVYINGSTSFLVFSSSFIKRCTESGTTLTCQKLNIVDVGDDSSDDDKPKSKKHSRDEDSDSDEDKPKKKHSSDDE